MNRRKLWALMAVPSLAVTALFLAFLLLGRSMAGAAPGERDYLTNGSSACDVLTDPMERDLCHFVTGVYSAGLLTDWDNPRLDNHFDHTPMFTYTEPSNWQAVSESASMLALYAALIGDQTTFDYLFNVSAPAEIGGTGAPISSNQESLYYFASPNLCLLHWILDKDGNKEDFDTGWLANAAGEENRWLEALSIAEQKFPDPEKKYHQFAKCLAGGLIGASDFISGAIGNFEDPGTPEAFDDYLLRPRFGWTWNFDSFGTITFTNLSYNNLMGWRYAAQLGQPFVDFYSNVLSYTTPLMADSIQQCGTDLPRVMYDVKRHFYYGEILISNLADTASCTASSYQDDMNCPACTCEKALDGNLLSTRWASNWNDDEWIALEFSEPITIDGVVLKWEAAYGEAYTIDVSDDGVIWTPIYTETNGDGVDDEIHFPLTTTRHIRMHGLIRGTPYGYSLLEFEVYRGGTSSLTALDLARRAAVYAKVSGDTALEDMGRRILAWYKAQYTAHISSTPTIAAYYDPCTGNRLDEQGDWLSIMADLAELAGEYGDYSFAHQVIKEKLRPKLITDPTNPLKGSVGPSAFDNLEVLLGLRHVLIVTADFTASPRCGMPPLTVVFTNRSTGNYTESLWDFGDGVTDTLESPTHTYTTTGFYTVTLTVSGPGDSDTATKTAYINVGCRFYLPTIMKN